MGDLARGNVWAVLPAFHQPGSKAEAKLPEQETLSCSCRWKLGHAQIWCPNSATPELSTGAEFPDNRSAFLPLCRGYHAGNEIPVERYTPNVTILTA